MTSSTPRASRSATTTWSRPALDEPIDDGSQITVRFGRPLELTVDGETQTYWVTATDVAGALQRDRRGVPATPSSPSAVAAASTAAASPSRW